MKDIIENIILLVSIMTVLICSVCLVLLAVDKHEKLECSKWRNEMEIYPNYYLADWQIEQCRWHGIELEK